MDFYQLFYTFAIYAFLGWIGEVIYAYIRHKKFVNRGFLYGPVCPIYGFGAAAIVTMIFDLTNKIPNNQTASLAVLFFSSVFVTTLIELITGFVLEKFFQAKWWDYSEEKFNIKGYICLKFSLLWGILVVIAYLLVNPFMSSFTFSINDNFGNTLFYPLLVYFTIDFSFTIKSLVDFRNIIIEINKLTEELRTELGTNIEDFKFDLNDNMLELKRKMGNKQEELRKIVEQSNENIKDNVEKIRDNVLIAKLEIVQKRNKKINKVLSKYEYLSNKLFRSRLYNIFPNMKSKRHKNILKKLREVKNKRIIRKL